MYPLMLESPGVRIGSFEILSPLGEGGMGAVYRARDPKLGRQVAIKILQHDLIASREHLRRFEREARAASALNHPNIVTIFEIDECDGEPFIAMELVDGERLRDLVAGGALPVPKLLDIAWQIANGLAAAHDRGIVHRDLKPENVMVNREGLVKILDFGLAHILREGGSNEPTDEMSGTDITSGQLLGTAAYMSPEQASGAPVDFRSDQFSFGSTLYELATGRRAFRRQSAMATLSAITNDRPEPIRQINRAIPTQLCRIIERCLAKNPADRYSSTHELAQALGSLRERHHGTLPITERFELPDRLRTRAWVVGAFLVVCVAIASTVYLSRSGPADGPHVVGTLPQHVYLAVLPFNDANVQADAQLFSRGLADAVSARLSRFSGLQVMPPSSSAKLVAEKADARRIAQELGATLLLRANVDTTGEKLRVRYSLFDPLRGVEVANGTLHGSTGSFWDTQDQVSDAIVRDLHLSGRARPVAVGLEAPGDQETFVHALGYLQRYENEQSVDAAILSLRDLMETAPDSAMVVATLGRAYLAKYNLTHDREWADRAITVCDRARTLDPDSTEVLMTLGDIARVTGRYDQGIGYYKRALALQPDSPEVALKLGNAYQASGKFAEAESAFRRGIELRPTWWSGYNELGFLNLTRNQNEDALSQFQTVIRLNPDSPWGYSNSGVVYLREGKLEQAQKAFLKAISLREDAAAYANLGYCFYFLGDFEKSAAAYQKAADLRPKVATNWANLGDACSWATSCTGTAPHAYDTAIQLLLGEVSLNPKNSRAQATLAICLAKRGKFVEAQKHIDDATKLEPENATRMYQAARVANLSGRQTDAISWLSRALAEGYQKFEIEHDPEFRTLRATDGFHVLFDRKGQPGAPTG